MNTQSNSLRYCKHCFKPEGRDHKLKRCAACLVALYCSPECQRAAWPDHKNICTGPSRKPPDSDANVLRYGYSSITSCQQDLQDFIRAHIWALRLNAKAHCHLYFDAQADQQILRPPRLLTIKLSCPSTPEHQERNPANKFTIVEQKFGDLDWYIRTFPDSWKYTASSREELHRTWDNHREFLGILTIMYFLPNTHVCSLDFQPVYRLGQCITSSSELRHHTICVMLEFCLNSINRGFPLRTLDKKSSAPIGLPGQYIRRPGKVWQWQPYFKDWKDYTPGKNAALDSAVAEISILGLPVQEVMRIVLSL